MFKKIIIQFLSIVLFSISLPAQDKLLEKGNGIATNEKCSSTISVRNGHRMIYDNFRKKAILFGGADASRVLGDLWEWNGKSWTCMASTASLARTFPGMAYDSNRKRIILFGGNRVLFGKGAEINTLLNDTWEWDGRSWVRIDVKGPSPRAEAAMVYDSKRRRVVLFGGYSIENGKYKRLGDTWEFDGERWVSVSNSGPSPRNGASMVYDDHHERIVLFGGNGESGDTWRWDGELWREIKTSVTPGRFNPVMAYDSREKKIIRFGGWNGTDRTGDTWSFDGKTWQHLNIGAPQARNHSAMVFDQERKTIVLFGGHNGEMVFGDTWELDGRSWIKANSTVPQKRIENGH